MMNNNIEVLTNASSFSFEELIHVAQRDNNSKRQFLLVNGKQGKHLPTDATQTLALFEQLGELAKRFYDRRQTVVIGFAETATAIGAAVAQVLGAKTVYLQTTRETLKDSINLLDFQEEYSHAVNQRLYCCQPQRWLAEAEVILLVEDEISTGQTILNLVAELRKLPYLRKQVQFAVLSLVNGLNEASLSKLSAAGIMCHYLLKLAYDSAWNPYPDLIAESTMMPLLEEKPSFVYKEIAGKVNSRSGCVIGVYHEAVLNLAQTVKAYLLQAPIPETILVLGTEELMYPAIITAQLLQNTLKATVKTHATTRSPIKISSQTADYPIINGCHLTSLYDPLRTTFVYNLTAYEQVVILFDSDEDSQKGLEELADCLHQFGCRQILALRWVTT